VKDWESEQHTEGHGSPFELPQKKGEHFSKQPHPVRADFPAAEKVKKTQVRVGKEELARALANEEPTRTGAGVEIEHQQTPGTFIKLGLDIEDTQ
jgi:hypothetical protein